ncbi:hypothetical protein LINGRAHAP2_LOCUS29195 [Linum grandiflorum]
MSVDRPMWIPSVLGLSSGASAVNLLNVKFLLPSTLTWKFLLSLLVIPSTRPLLMAWNLRLTVLDFCLPQMAGP